MFRGIMAGLLPVRTDDSAGRSAAANFSGEARVFLRDREGDLLMHTDNQTQPTHTTTISKRRRSWRFLAPALAVLTLGGGVVATAAHAQMAEQADADANGGGFGGHRLQKLLDKVNATPAQRSQIEGIWNNLRPQMKANRQQRQAVRQQMAAAFTAPSVNATQVEQLRQQSMSLADKQSQLFTQGLVQTAQVLSQAQRQQAQAAIEQARARFHHHFGHEPQP
jgi:Spy/CpxP family protein refolding chaperone